MIGVINCGLGNIGSVLNMLRRLAIPARPVTAVADFEGTQRLILPGVGAFDAGMTALLQSGLMDEVNRRVMEQAVPVLGICLGMQLLSRRSEEGVLPGLGWIPADTVRFDFSSPKHAALKIPHMGWNEVTPVPGSPLFGGFTDAPRFYFVHSYHVRCDDPAHVAATVNYGGRSAAAVQRAHIFGTQFHPEKSHRFGMKVLENFARV